MVKEKKPRFTINNYLDKEQYNKFIKIKQKLKCSSDSDAILDSDLFQVE
jgi:hypothetical protein